VTVSLLTALLLSAPLFQPGAAETERFKAYFTKGEQLYQAGEYGAAIWNFRRADEIRVTPEVAYDLAKCHEKVNDVAFTVLYYRLYLRRAPGASDALDVAEKVGNALAQAEAEGRGFLEVEAPGAKSLTIQGHTYPETPIALFLAPGDVELSGIFGEGTRKMVAQLRTGKASVVFFEPNPAPLLEADGAPAAAVDVAAARALEPKGPGPSKLRISSYVVAGAGLAAIAVGSVLGVMARGEASRVETDKSLTYAQATEVAGSASSKGLAANLLWGVGGAALAGGVVMFVVSMPEPGMKEQRSTP